MLFCPGDLDETMAFGDTLPTVHRFVLSDFETDKSIFDHVDVALGLIFRKWSFSSVHEYFAPCLHVISFCSMSINCGKLDGCKLQ